MPGSFQQHRFAVSLVWTGLTLSKVVVIPDLKPHCVKRDYCFSLKVLAPTKQYPSADVYVFGFHSVKPGSIGQSCRDSRGN